MKINECVNTRSEITELKVLGDKLIAYSTKLHGLKFYSLEESKTTLNLSSEFLNSQTAAIAFSKDSKHVALANAQVIDILHIPSNQLIKKISTDEDLEILAFDLSSMYIIAGTKSGRVLQYRYNEISLLSRLCSFPANQEIDRSKIKQNFVSAFAFHKNKIACSGYGGSIVIIDLHSLSHKEILTHDKVRTDALCFADKEIIISGNIDGIIHVRSLQDKNFHKQISVPFSRIKKILLMPNPEYIMVSGDSNSVAIVDIKRYKIARSKYIEFEDKIQHIALLDDETMVVALKNMKILAVELPSIEKLKSLILHNSLDEAFKLIENEPMLMGSNEHKELKKKFDKVYLDALDALINHKKNFALQITGMFKEIPLLKEKIKLLFEAFDYYPRFQVLCAEQKLSLAYAMAYKYPALQHTWQYKRMEEAWKSAFINAQKQVLLGNKENAKMYLNAYVTVLSKKELIQLILKNNSEFIQFLKAIANKDFATVDKLASQYSIFTEIPTYIALNEEMDTHLQQAKKYVEKGVIKSASIYLDKIKDMPKMKDEFIKLNKKCKTILKLNEFYEQNNFNSCYEMIDTNRYLSSIKLAVLLEKHWYKVIHTCEEYALQGNIREIKNTLGELMKLRTRRDKIGNLLRLSFHAKIKILMAKKAFKQAETVIYSYIDIFGLDQEVGAIMKTFEIKSSSKLAITHTENYRPKRDAWINSEIIMGKLP